MFHSAFFFFHLIFACTYVQTVLFGWPMLADIIQNPILRGLARLERESFNPLSIYPFLLVRVERTDDSIKANPAQGKSRKFI